MPRRRKKALDTQALRGKILATLRDGPAIRSDLYEALGNNVTGAELDALLDALRRDGLIRIDSVLKTYTMKRLVLQVALTPEGERLGVPRK
jgi:hypothetical protein